MDVDELAAESRQADDAVDGSSLMGRRRAQSVTSVASVETVIVKAKRAASSLWMLLHSQNCAGISCPHTGCYEAKLLQLHIKTCAAGGNFDCPANHPGCDKARKLLAHYHRCRTTRARQVGQMPSRRDAGQQQCLVCSLVARQARTMLERNSVISLSGGASSTKLTTKQHSSPSSFDVPTKVIGEPIGSPNSSEEFMPPPPPRPARALPAMATFDKVDSGSAGTKLRQLSAALSDPSLACLAQDEYGGSFDSAMKNYGYKSQPLNLARGRDRSLSTSKTVLKSKHVSVGTATSVRHRRRRSASVGCIPCAGSTSCSTIEEEEPLIE
ncbi:hypothetical protein MPSEU_000103900 [Mayamaea pseudoterrestris]|nr:hypothetical protein MPSEU_000103900 [Mayamaea pseudoterrestris]